MEFEKIIENLKNADIKPTADCWEKIEQNLAAGVGASSSHTQPYKSAAKIAGTAAGKAAAIIVGTIAITTAVTFVTLKLNTTQDTIPNNEPTEVATITNATLSDTLLVDNQTNTDVDQTPEISVVHTPETTVITEKMQNASQQAQQVQPAKDSSHLPPLSQPVTQQITDNNLEKTVQPNTIPQTTDTKDNTEQPSVQETELPQITESDATEPTAEQDDLFLEIPNVITPNGDGINDVFVIKGLDKCEKFLLTIKNQSGRQVLNTRVYHNDWGSDIAEGTYFYSIFYEYNGKQQMRNGVITVVK